MISILLIEDDRDIREALRLLIESTEEMTCRGAFRSAEAALKADLIQIDITLLDVELPGMTGIEVIPLLRDKGLTGQILMLTVHQEDHIVFESLCAGATGYLIKTTPPDKILDAIREAHEGGAPMSAGVARMVIGSFKKNTSPVLTPRENEILGFLCQGHSYKMVADAMNISRETVHSHIKSIYKKLNVNSKSEAVIKAIKGKLV